MFKQTALTSVDSYKLGHADQYPEGTTKVYSNFTPRKASYFKAVTCDLENKIVWFGLQAFLQEMNDIWNATFFCKDKETVVNEYKEFVAPFVGPNGFDVSRLEQLHDLGYLPIKIKAIEEGNVVSTGVPVLTITNTENFAYWLPNFLETWLSSELWKSSTSATISFNYKKLIEKYAELTGGSKEFITWQGHDFSVRGMSGINDSAKSGAGHLLSFTGTDNIPAVKLLKDCYSGDNTFIGGSVPATEHSVMCAGGRDTEIDTFKRLISTYNSGVVSIVSDTWDFWNVITNTASVLKEDILNRKEDSFGLSKVVFRPDSGDPVKIITGYKNSEISYVRDKETEKLTAIANGKEISEAEVKGAVECLADIFGYTVNEKGFKTLNQKVGLIYGDSITLQRAEDILKRLADKGFASDNIVFGIGSYTFQYNTRDTFGFAMKATYVEINGKGVEIFKEPKTDSGLKKSAKGLLMVEKDGSNYTLSDSVTEDQEKLGELRTVYENGKIFSNLTLQKVRENLSMY
jgi:nicotinamide phosphoribosyltransferase